MTEDSVDTYDDSGAPRAAFGIVYQPNLVVVLECDRPLAGGARFSLEATDLVTLGRGGARRATRANSEGVHILDLRIPGRSMSARHARLVRVGDSWAIEDLGSTNGTFVNGIRTERAVLQPDDVVEIGHTLLRLNPSLPVPRTAPLEAEIADPWAREPATLDPVFAAHLERLAKLAGSHVPVLLVGQSGSGKEVVARWLHERSGRRGAFVAVNCGAIPSALLEGQLFGHVKGAFTGALRSEMGFARAAHGGTLFLDEVADLPLGSQAALLRILQEREVVPVGATRPIPVDFQLVAATHEPIDALVERGTLRRDLVARVAGTVLTLPPLRSRRDDVGVLVAALLARLADGNSASVRLAPDVGRALLTYDWPMNIRELEQCLRASLALAHGGVVHREHLPPKVSATLDQVRDPPRSVDPFSERDERLRLELLAQLAKHHGSLADVGRAMGKARTQVHRWCRRLGIDPNVYRR